MRDADRLIHEVLQTKFRRLLEGEVNLRNIIFQILAEGTAYLIGGFVRDVFENKRSRDIDIVVDIPNDRLKMIIEGEKCSKQFNRLGGAKLQLQNVCIDIWSFDNNWAFRNELVKLNENEKLNSLAKGCFYNYDALVVNISKFSYNIKYFDSFCEKKELDILQKRAIYKNLNPTLEANILRAIFVQKEYGISFTENLKEYVYLKIQALNDLYGDAVERLVAVKDGYPKYKTVDKNDILRSFEEIKKERPLTFF